jgi:hypothetical protein
MTAHQMRQVIKEHGSEVAEQATLAVEKATGPVMKQLKAMQRELHYGPKEGDNRNNRITEEVMGTGIMGIGTGNVAIIMVEIGEETA